MTSVLAKRESSSLALRAIVPGEGVIADEDELRAYECDGLTAYRAVPMAVVLPSTTAQVVGRAGACATREGVKVVPRGAGTSLSGGALPHHRRHRARHGQVQPRSSTSTSRTAP